MAEALDPAIPDDIERLAQEVLQSACDRELMLATAESCTGGLLASLLTDIPGRSHAFERGFVTYSDDAKHELLGVSRAILEADGAVSEPCARAMAEGAVAASRAHLAVSITGFAEGPEAGLVHLACARRGGPTRIRTERFGDVGRAEVRLGALRAGLQLFADGLRDLARAA
ncbi:CinA family protein [Phenylobacterium sp.]|uniref:CinA family protein n=1 Tax=Phenylobacterium sp. TaxID=1871053 RepID=UPI0025FEDC69|nr:CinA family protein [Phenylobacterium sp.]